MGRVQDHTLGMHVCDYKYNRSCHTYRTVSTAVHFVVVAGGHEEELPYWYWCTVDWPELHWRCQAFVSLWKYTSRTRDTRSTGKNVPPTLYRSTALPP